MGHLLAPPAARADRGPRGRRRGSEARRRRDDGHEEDRRRRDQGGATRLTFHHKNVRSLLAALGVTRVARVTGLDRAGVEVACAVRPGGHVLQISNGKGETWEEARASALSEAAELWAAERVPSGLLFASARELGQRAWLDSADVAAPRLFSSALRIGWIDARDLISGATVLVPAQAVHCPPPGSASLGPGPFRWSSNGMAAHPRSSQALLHALLEPAERDRLATALPEGWNPPAIRTRKIAPETLP